jgi:hypothetical protein
VTWTNKDDIPHGIASDNNAFRRSKALDTDDKFAFTFTTPGTYKYFCYIHPHMTGSIVVQPNGGWRHCVSMRDRWRAKPLQDFGRPSTRR